jgi:hypothetical protein
VPVHLHLQLQGVRFYYVKGLILSSVTSTSFKSPA